MRLPVQLADFQIQYLPDSSSWYCYRSSLYVTVFKHTTSNKPKKTNIKSWSRNAIRYLALVLDIPGCGWHRADTWNDRFPKWEKQRRKQSNSDILQHYPKIIKNHPFVTYDSQLWTSLSGSPIDSRWFQYSPVMFIFCPVLPPLHFCKSHIANGQVLGASGGSPSGFAMSKTNGRWQTHQITQDVAGFPQPGCAVRKKHTWLIMVM